tara:strand:- start:330 stop:1199 length:870 start_codon:yes stop_codon:yes gene_type:complete
MAIASQETTITANKGNKLLQYKRESLLQKRMKRYFSGSDNSRNKLKALFYKSNLKLGPAQIFLGILFMAFLLSALLIVFLKMSAYLALTISMIGSVLIFFGILSQRATTHEQKFLDNFPLALDIIVRGLKAGFTIEKTFLTIAEEIADPVGGEFLTITEQITFGVPYEEALKNIALKVDHPDFDFFVVALVIQRRTGGPLSELIENITFVLRKREELRLKVKALSAEARATGLIVGSLPFIATLAMMYFKPGYIQAFLDDEVGRKLLYSVIAMITATAIVVKQLTKFRL